MGDGVENLGTWIPGPMSSKEAGGLEPVPLNNRKVLTGAGCSFYTRTCQWAALGLPTDGEWPKGRKLSDGEWPKGRKLSPVP